MTVMTMPATAIPNYQDVARRYADAWNAHDVGAIMAMHSDDTHYHLHGEVERCAEAVVLIWLENHGCKTRTAKWISWGLRTRQSAQANRELVRRVSVRRAAYLPGPIAKFSNIGKGSIGLMHVLSFRRRRGIGRQLQRSDACGRQSVQNKINIASRPRVCHSTALLIAGSNHDGGGC